MRAAPFVLISTDHGSMIVNRNDYHMGDGGDGYGVGYQLMTKSSYDWSEVQLAKYLLRVQLHENGPGVVALDVGANIGVHTLEWSKYLGADGVVHSFEAQERLYYALCGNVALNNSLNVHCHHAAVGAESGSLTMREPDYTQPASFGSYELRQHATSEYIGQAIGEAHAQVKVPMLALDSLDLPRIDFVKIDVEGMEMEVLQGASGLLAQHRPLLLIEHIKTDAEALDAFLAALDYDYHLIGMNTLAFPMGHALEALVEVVGESLRLRPIH